MKRPIESMMKWLIDETADRIDDEMGDEMDNRIDDKMGDEMDNGIDDRID